MAYAYIYCMQHLQVDEFKLKELLLLTQYILNNLNIKKSLNFWNSHTSIFHNYSDDTRIPSCYGDQKVISTLSLEPSSSARQFIVSFYKAFQ
jgi:hypothetical protein